jgi:hypothetical protein
MRKVHNVGSDGGGGGGGSGSAAPSDTADNSGAEIDSPPPPRFAKRPRQSLRSREQILKEISEVEREVVVRDEELREARQRKVDVVVRLERLRAELEDGRFSSSPCFSPTVIPCYPDSTSPPSAAAFSRGSTSCSPPAVLFPSSPAPSALSFGTLSLPPLPSPLGQSGYGFMFPSPPTPPADVGSSSLYPAPAAPPPWLLPSSWPNN